MKVLSVKQPWAYLLVSGIKDIENRPRRTHFRGRILIHASAKAFKGYNVQYNSFDYKTKFGCLSKEQYEQLFGMDLIKYNSNDLDYSSIIGSVEIVDCVENHPSIWAVEGQYHYVIANPILFDTPITGIKGQLGLWNYEFEPETCGCGSLDGIDCVCNMDEDE